jgi:hypothetical protein
MAGQETGGNSKKQLANLSPSIRRYLAEIGIKGASKNHYLHQLITSIG